MYQLWFNFVFGLKIFKPVYFLFFFVEYLLPYSETKGNKNQIGHFQVVVNLTMKARLSAKLFI